MSPLFFVALTALLACATASAQEIREGRELAKGERKLARGEEAPPPSGLREARGRVGRLDKANARLTLQRGPREELVLQVEPSTTLFIDGRIGKLSDLREGAQVRVSFEQRDGANRAQWIEVNRRGAAATAPTELFPSEPRGMKEPRPNSD